MVSNSADQEKAISSDAEHLNSANSVSQNGVYESSLYFYLLPNSLKKKIILVFEKRNTKLRA